MDERVGEAERHAGVVGPRSGVQVERTTADKIAHFWAAIASCELKGGAERVANGKAQHSADRTIT
jgi:hypothetical protein